MKTKQLALMSAALAAVLILGACAGEGTSSTGSTSTTATTSTTSTTSTSAGQAVSFIVRGQADPIAFRDGDGPWAVLETQPYRTGGVTFGRAVATVHDAQGRYSFARLDNGTDIAIYDADTEDAVDIDSVGVEERVFNDQPRTEWSERTIGVADGVMTSISTNQGGLNVKRGVFPIWNRGAIGDFIAVSPSDGNPADRKSIMYFGLTDPSQQVLFNFASDQALPLQRTSMSAHSSAVGFGITSRGVVFGLNNQMEGGSLAMYTPPLDQLPADTWFQVTSYRSQPAITVQNTVLSGTDLPALNVAPQFLPEMTNIFAARTDSAARIYTVRFDAFASATMLFLDAQSRKYYVSPKRLTTNSGVSEYVSPGLIQLGSLAPFATAMTKPFAEQVTISVQLSGRPYPIAKGTYATLPGPYAMIPGWGSASFAESLAFRVPAP